MQKVQDQQRVVQIPSVRISTLNNPKEVNAQKVKTTNAAVTKQ